MAFAIPSHSPSSDCFAGVFVIAKTIDMTSVPLLTHDSFDDLAVDPPNPNLETYDWPGEYAQRFDGDDKGGDTFDFQPQLTTEPTAPGEDVMCQNNLRIGDSFSFTDYKPTESLAVDPTNPDVGSSGHTGGANFVFCDGAVRSDEGPQFTTEPTA